MIPISGKLKDDLEKKYRKRQNLPNIAIKKVSLSECYSCKHYERWNNGKDLHWCVSRYYDRIKKRSVIRYQNIELLKTCPKVMCKK